jgi:putative hemolysin
MTTILIIFVCLALNAVLASIEMALVTVRKTELKNLAKKGHSKATRLLLLRDNPERALSIIQIGITLVGAISAAVGGAGAEEKLAPYFEATYGWSEKLAEGVAIGLIVLPLTYLSVVVGELVPKTIALRYPMRVLHFGLFWLEIGEKLFSPVITLLEMSTKVLLLLLPKVNKDAEASPHVDLDGIPKYHQQYIVNLANIETRRIGEILLPWEQVDYIDHQAVFDAVLNRVIQSGHTRLPVVNGNVVEGTLNSKELLAFASSGSRDWQTLIRPAVVVPPNGEILRTLRQLQSQRRHMAIVIDKETILGLVTVEDIFEEVIGDLFDEDDDGFVRRLLTQRGVRTALKTPSK